MTVEQQIQQAIDQWEHRLRLAIQRRDSLTAEIMTIEQNIRNLQSALFEQRAADQMEVESIIGLTEAIRTVMRRAGGVPMTPQDVKLALTVTGFDLSRFRNPIGAITNTLQRMHKAGELRFWPLAKQYQPERMKL